MSKKTNPEIKEISKWFRESVVFEGAPFVMDYEQIAAVIDTHKNTIVSARAGSGKTRTIVAKLTYLIAKKHLDPSELLVFVFNHNAAIEINARLEHILVDGQPLGKDLHVATTFHAFARHIVYNLCGESLKFGRILADTKDVYLSFLLRSLPPKIIYDFYHLHPDFTSVVEYRRAFTSFSSLLSQFIDRAEQEFSDDLPRLKSLVSAVTNPRTKLFLTTGLTYYQKYLLSLSHQITPPLTFEKYGIDFSLLIHVATKRILSRSSPAITASLSKIKYILVDEYQDFSRLFLNIVNAVRALAPDSHLFVVGDDWQAINRFAGSSVTYFNDFSTFFSEDSNRLFISTNYRCDRDIVASARRFINKSMHEKSHFRAFSRKLGHVYLHSATTLDHYLATISKIIRQNPGRPILLLHRNNQTSFGLTLTDFYTRLRYIYCTTYATSSAPDLASPSAKTTSSAPDLASLAASFRQQVRIMTMHKSKGLESDIVIILEADEGVIPSTFVPTGLFEIFGETEEDTLDDAKRLFYVALTRAKHELHILHQPSPTLAKSPFLQYLNPNLYESDDE